MGKLKYLGRRFGGLNSDQLTFLYKTNIRPIFEYGAPVLLSTSKTFKKKIESIQHQFLSRCIGIDYRANDRACRIYCNTIPIIERLTALSISFFAKLKRTNQPTYIKIANNKNATFSQKKTGCHWAEVKRAEWGLKEDALHSKTITNILKKMHRKEWVCGPSSHPDELPLRLYLPIRNKLPRRWETAINGTLFGLLRTKYLLFKRKISVSNICDKCDTKDSSLHKIFRCKTLADVREELLSCRSIENDVAAIFCAKFPEEIARLVGTWWRRVGKA